MVIQAGSKPVHHGHSGGHFALPPWPFGWELTPPATATTSLRAKPGKSSVSSGRLFIAPETGHLKIIIFSNMRFFGKLFLLLHVLSNVFPKSCDLGERAPQGRASQSRDLGERAPVFVLKRMGNTFKTLQKR